MNQEKQKIFLFLDCETSVVTVDSEEEAEAFERGFSAGMRAGHDGGYTITYPLQADQLVECLSDRKFDSDDTQLIEKHLGCTVAEFIEKHGEK